MSFADLPMDILERLCAYLAADDVCRLAAVARRIRAAVQFAELHFPVDKARLTGRRSAALAFALQNPSRVVRLGALAAVEDGLFSTGSLGPLAAFQRLTELELGFPVSVDTIGMLPRGLRRLQLWLHYRTMPMMLDVSAFPPALEDLALEVTDVCTVDRFAGGVLVSLDAAFSGALGRLRRLSIAGISRTTLSVSPNLRLPHLEYLHLARMLADPATLARLDTAALPHLRVLRTALFCVTPSVKNYPASLRGLELSFYLADRNLRCLPGLRRLALNGRPSVPENINDWVYRLPAGLKYLAVSGAGIVHLDTSACSKELLIMADHGIRLEFVGQDGEKAACRRVMWLNRVKLHAWVCDSLSCDVKCH